MSQQISSDDRLMAAIGHALTFVEGGIIGPLILYLIKREQSEFVAFHALQSLYFGLLFLVLTLVSCGLLALPLVLPYLIFEIIAAVKANDGEWYRLPIVGDWALRRHPPPV